MQEPIAVGITRVVLALGVDVGEGDLNRVELVLADAPVEDLLPARRGVKAPPRAIRNDGNREREVVPPHDQDHPAAAGLEAVLFIVRGHEALPDAPVSHRVSRRDEPLSVLAENRQQCLLVPRPEGGDQGVRGLPERGEAALRVGEGGGAPPGGKAHGHEDRGDEAPLDAANPVTSLPTRDRSLPTIRLTADLPRARPRRPRPPLRRRPRRARPRRARLR